MKTLGDFNQYAYHIGDEDVSRVLLAVVYVLQFQDHVSLAIELNSDVFFNLRAVLLHRLNKETDISPDSKKRERLSDLAMGHIKKAEDKFLQLPVVVA